VTGFRLIPAIIVVLAVARAAGAQQVAVRHYTVDDGLANDTVGSAYQDSHGFLWFATAEGLSRFDGYRFVTYSKSDGLGANVVHRIEESLDGTLWVATAGGLSKLIETPGRGSFVTTAVRPGRAVSAFAVASDNAIWCIQDDGVYRGIAHGTGIAWTRVAAHPDSQWRPRAFRDRSGRLWLSRDSTLFHVDGASLTPHRDPAGTEPIRGIAQRGDGGLIVARLRTMSIVTVGATAAEDRWTTTRVDFGDGEVQALLADTRDRLWVGTTKGLATVDLSSGRATYVRTVTTHVAGLLEDRDGNIWATTLDNGVFKLNREPVVSYGQAEGLVDPFVTAVVDGDGGRIYAVTRGGTYEIGTDAGRFLPGSNLPPFNTIGRKILYDGQGWWMWTAAGLYRAGSPLDFRRARRAHGAGPPFPLDADGPSLAVDGSRTVWIGTPGIRVLRAPRDVPEHQWKAVQLEQTIAAPGSMAVTRKGTVWFGTHSQLVRLNGTRPQVFSAQRGFPDTFVRALFIDSRGWLWIGSFNGGVSVVRDPDAADPAFENYSPADGLASHYVNGIAEDLHGRLYFVTGRGLDRLDPQTGKIRHLTTADGLAGAKVTYCMRDSRGRLWIGTATGLSRLVPSDDDREHLPAPVAILAVRAGDEDVPLPPRGTREPLSLRLAPSRANVQIEYVAVEFRGERTLRYQFRLEGSGQPWSAPTDSRSVIYGNLAPGTYGFRVRAVSADGRIGAETAALAFTILPPVWQRWWFVLLAFATIGSAAFWMYRQRVNRLLAVERVRRQVALDLHDDVGAGLVQIAAMGELAAEDPDLGVRMWPDVAAVARSLRDSMSDIVWAVDPNKDHLADLAQRLKDVAYASLEADGVSVTFEAPPPADMARVQMPTDRRRHVLLVLKEAVANIVRHAGATHVKVALTLHGGELRLVIADNGKGFDAGAGAGGNGLLSMRRRASEAGGSLAILSTPGQGTTITLTVPA
jgi:signal transduction histidine kinase/ligand-binding sensor domain-containing protein